MENLGVLNTFNGLVMSLSFPNPLQFDLLEERQEKYKLSFHDSRGGGWGWG
jgi:hypothetical protein